MCEETISQTLDRIMRKNQIKEAQKAIRRAAKVNFATGRAFTHERMMRNIVNTKAEIERMKIKFEVPPEHAERINEYDDMLNRALDLMAMISDLSSEAWGLVTEVQDKLGIPEYLASGRRIKK